MWCRSRLEAHVIGYNRHYQASEARRSAKYIRTNHRLRWPSAFSSLGRELLGADGTWVWGIGGLWGVTFESQSAAAPACFVELHLEDGFPWYKDDSLLDRKDDPVEACGFQHAARPSGSELTVPAATTKHIHRDVLSYPDAWYFAGQIAEFLMKPLFLS